MFGLGIGEVAIILFIALIFIGPKKLPELARGLGKGMREFQNAAKGLQGQIQNPVEDIKKEVTDITLEDCEAEKRAEKSDASVSDEVPISRKS